MSSAVPHDLHSVLRQRFGLESFRGEQEAVIRTLLSGKSALALFPTGAGKSLCYQLPALLWEGVTLVISPLIALMKDQVESLQRRGIDAARIDSTIADDEVSDIIQCLHEGTLSLLYLSPERLASRSFRKQMLGLKISMLAIDEAHCISEWGHNFRPDYLKIARFSKRLKVERILALTATATPRVAQDIRKSFRIAKSCVFHGGFHRPNLHLSVIDCSVDEKDHRLIEHLHAYEGPAIVYATTRRDTERLAALLQKNGFAARSYHAGLPTEMREQAQESFLHHRTRVIVATIAFGMGIDKADIRSIIHYHLPKSIEGYSQEIGRAGRDGLMAQCVLLADRSDTQTLENFIHAATPSPQSLRNLLDRLLRLAAPGKSFAISPYELSISQDMREETLRTVMAYLELDQIIERSGHYYDYFRVRLLHKLDRVVAGYSSTEKKRIRQLFAAAECNYGSYHFRLYEISERLGIRREKVAEIITALADAGDIRLEQRSIREVYVRSKTATFSIAEVIEQMLARFESRASFEFERIRSVVRYIESRTCRARFLAKHFGVTVPACGVCDICLGGKPLRLKQPVAPSLPADEWQKMLDLRAEDHASLGTARQLALFLCGISSPAAYQAKLQSRDEFGMWQEQNFHEVLTMLEA